MMKILLCSILLIAAPWVARAEEVPSAFANGQAQARQDVAAGLVRIKTYGLPAPWFGEYTALLKSRCGAEAQGVAGCVVDQATVEFVRGYNGVSREFLKNKFGTNIFGELETAAEKAWDARIASASNAARTHKIQAGDTLLAIARKMRVTVKSLAVANPGVNSLNLRIGQVLQVPPANIPETNKP